MTPTTRPTVDVVAGSIKIFGDTHFSAQYEGSHRDYRKNCYTVMERIISIVESDDRTTAVLGLGDMSGVMEQLVRDRIFLSDTMKFWRKLNLIIRRNAKNLSGDPSKSVLANVKGNHDMGGRAAFTEFDFMLDQGLFVNPSHINFFREDGDLEARIHFANWGEEGREFDFAEDASNIVLGHGEYVIPGVTNWLPSSDAAKDITRMPNLVGADYLFSGHIHTPSEQIDMVNQGNGRSIGLFYPGSPARVAERVEVIFYIDLNNTGGDTDLQMLDMELPSVEETFFPKEEFVTEDTELVSEDDERRGKLSDIMGQLMQHRFSQGDLSDQIRAVPYSSQEAQDLALEYVRKAG